MNIYQKMLKATDEIGVVAKNLNVSTGGYGSYKAVGERDILDAVKPIEAKYGIYSFPYKRNIIENDILESVKTDRNGNETRSTSKYMRLEVTYRFINTDNPEEFIDITAYGDGIDTGDKAPGKAMTYADKYALMKAYKISTGDDPDQEASPEQGYRKKESKKETKKESKFPKSHADEMNNVELVSFFQAAYEPKDREAIRKFNGVDDDFSIPRVKIEKYVEDKWDYIKTICPTVKAEAVPFDFTEEQEVKPY